MRHTPLHLALLVTSSIAFVVTVTINAVLNSGRASDLGVKDSIGKVGTNNPVDILPAGWTFSVWLVIYPWQGLWIVYAWIFVFRQSTITPVNKLVHVIFILSCVFNITWLYLFGNEKFTASFVMILVLEVTLDVLIGVASYTSYHQTQELVENGQKRDVVLVQVFLNNGIAVYETWVTIAAQVNFAVALQYDYDVSSSTAAIVALSIILVEMGTWFLAEITIFDRYIRYTLTVYPVVIWALAGIIANNYKDGKTTSVLSVVAICTACCILITRAILTVVYHWKKPLYARNQSTVAVKVFAKSPTKNQ